jgi:hypothetical protein
MTWLIERLPVVAVAALAMTLAGCAETAYVEHANARAVTAKGEEDAFARTVDFHLARAFYATPPGCVMVAPTNLKTVPAGVRQAIEDTVARHLASRVDRVIDARRAAGEARRQAFDPAFAPDRARLARALQCDTVAEIDSAALDSLYAVVWTEISVDVHLTLKRARDGEVLWRGRHRARRGDGGLPIGLFGAGGGALAAGRLAGDADVLPSIIDDSLRRMMASLPDVRRF